MDDREVEAASVLERVGAEAQRCLVAGLWLVTLGVAAEFGVMRGAVVCGSLLLVYGAVMGWWLLKR